jgi:hypothetical protein
MYITSDIHRLWRVHLRSENSSIVLSQRSWDALGCPGEPKISGPGNIANGTILEVDIMIAWTQMSLSSVNLDIPIFAGEVDTGIRTKIYHDDYAAVLLRFQLACCCDCEEGKYQNHKFVGASYFSLWDDITDRNKKDGRFSARSSPGSEEDWKGHTEWSREGTELHRNKISC